MDEQKLKTLQETIDTVESVLCIVGSLFGAIAVTGIVYVFVFNPPVGPLYYYCIGLLAMVTAIDVVVSATMLQINRKLQGRAGFSSLWIISFVWFFASAIYFSDAASMAR